MLMGMDRVVMPEDLKVMFDSMIRELNKSVPEFGNTISDLKQKIRICAETVHRLRKYVLDNAFEDIQSEIRFFKFIKPQFYAYFIYYSKIYQLEVLRPISHSEEDVSYLNEVLKTISDYFNRHRSLYEYLRMGSDFLDDKYFVRVSFSTDHLIDSYSLDADPVFCSTHDYKVARILANEMISAYVKQTLGISKRNPASRSDTVSDTEHLTWTASKAALIELIYACQSLGTFNNGEADIREIADLFERVFKVDLGNLYRTFQEIRIRKKGRTFFLDQLRDELIKRMDFTDEHPK
jgi:hypothetical protein